MSRAHMLRSSRRKKSPMFLSPAPGQRRIGSCSDPEPDLTLTTASPKVVSGQKVSPAASCIVPTCECPDLKLALLYSGVVVPTTVFRWNRFSRGLSGFCVGFLRFHADNRIVMTGVEPKMTKKCAEPFFRYLRGNQYQHQKTMFGDLRLLSISPARSGPPLTLILSLHQSA